MMEVNVKANTIYHNAAFRTRENARNGNSHLACSILGRSEQVEASTINNMTASCACRKCQEWQPALGMLSFTMT